MLFFVLLICTTMIGVSAQNCGDTRKMRCKQSCPETNGLRWTTYKKTGHGCCTPGLSCGGTHRHCRLECDKCSCPSGYRVKDPNQTTKTWRGSTERTNECCQKQCQASDCTGDWELKMRATFCEGATCPKNTGTCCSYKGNRLQPGETIEVVKTGNCESNGFEFIKNVEDCKVAGRIVGMTDEYTLNHPFPMASQYIGCYTDDSDRDLIWGPRTYGHTSATCSTACKDYKYYALQDGGQCFCGDRYATEVEYTQVDDSECGAHLRGGRWRNAVYRQNGASGVDSQFIGCYTDDSDRDLNEGPRTYGHTSATCSTACKDYKYYALQNGGWCVCGNRYATELQYTQVNDSECGADLRGGPWRNAVYRQNGASEGGNRQKYCGTWGGMTYLHFNSQTSGSIGGYPVLQNAGRDVGGEADTFQICKGKTTDSLRCGSHACAYYYTGIGGTKVRDLLNHQKFKRGKIELMEQISGGLKTRESYGNDYGVFVEAWINAPHTGNYRFKTRSDDASVVYASLWPNTKNGEMIKMVELESCCQRVTGTTEVYWEAGKTYYVYGYMKEGGGDDYFEIGFKNVWQDLNIVPQSYLAGGGCTSIRLDNIYIVSQEIDRTEINSQIREQTIIGADNCRSLHDASVAIEKGQTTTISTHFENTYTESWERTWGISANVGSTVTVEWETGFLVEAVGGVGNKVTAEVRVDLGSNLDTTDSWNDETTNGHSTTEETFSNVRYEWAQPAETKSDVIITGNKFNFRVTWAGQAVCLNDKREQVGPSKEVGGVYKSFGYTEISYSKADGICDGGRYCQPDIRTLAASLRLTDPDQILQRNYLAEPLRDACDVSKGGVDCSKLPLQCRDNQESQAEWIYSKWFIEKCSGDFDVNNPCLCEMPIQVDGVGRVPTASLEWVNENAFGSCTYGLPGSYGYDTIPDSHKPANRPFSSLAEIQSDRAHAQAFGRRRISEGTIKSGLATRLATMEGEAETQI